MEERKKLRNKRRKGKKNKKKIETNFFSNPQFI